MVVGEGPSEDQEFERFLENGKLMGWSCWINSVDMAVGVVSCGHLWKDAQSQGLRAGEGPGQRAGVSVEPPISKMAGLPRQTSSGNPPGRTLSGNPRPLSPLAVCGGGGCQPFCLPIVNACNRKPVSSHACLCPQSFQAAQHP